MYAEEFDQGSEGVDKDKLSTLLVGARSPVDQQRKLLRKPNRNDFKLQEGASSSRAGDVFKGDSVRMKERLASQS